jgi:hypothetical protein
MAGEIVDDDDNGFSNDDLDPAIDGNIPNLSEQSTARRKIEELMERRRLRQLIDDPYQDDLDGEL